MTVHMNLCNQFTEKEKFTFSKFILDILEANTSVAFAMYLSLQSNCVAVTVQLVHKDNVTLRFLC